MVNLLNSVLPPANQAVVLRNLKSLGLHLAALAAVGVLSVAVSMVPQLHLASDVTLNTLLLGALADALKKVLDMASQWEKTTETPAQQ